MQIDQPVEDSFGIRPTVHVIAERDDGVGPIRVHVGEQQVEGAGAAVNVADGEDAGHDD